MTDDERLALRLRLARTPGVGPATARLLEESQGGLRPLFQRSPSELIAAGVSERLARALHAPGLAAAVAREQARLKALGALAIPLGDPRYPPALAAIHDPPQVLTVLGELDPGPRAVAIVGPRRASPLGREVAADLGARLAAAGWAVVSGLARGVDAAAHRGALSSGGPTVAVLAGGLARVHPACHRDLARLVARAGALLSEVSPDEEPRRHSFPRRNRIVAGLAAGTVVVEAGARSGALITAELALNEGRELLAVPGALSNPLAAGTNRLLRDGAHVVTCARDVLDLLEGVAPAPEPEPDLGPDARALLAAIGRRGRDADALAEAAGLPLPQAREALGLLELVGEVARTPAGYVRRRPAVEAS